MQFKHRNVRSAMEGIGPAVFEGYVGTSPSGFPAEVELAKQAAVDLYVEKLAAAHAGSATGAARVNAHLEELRAELADLGAPKRSPLQNGRRRTPEGHAAKRRPHLFVGPLTDCFFDPDKALCLRDIRALRRRRSDHRPLPTATLPELPCRREPPPAWEARFAQVRADLASVTCPLCNVNILPNSETVSKRPVDRSNNSPTDSNDGGRP